MNQIKKNKNLITQFLKIPKIIKITIITAIIKIKINKRQLMSTIKDF